MEDIAIATIIIQLLLAVLLIAMGSVGYRNRLFTTTTIFLRLVFAFLVGYGFAGPFGWVLAKLAPTAGMSFWEFVAFALLFAAVFLVLTHATMVRVESDDITYPATIDRIGGTAMGVACGALLGGMLLVFLSMAMPLLPDRLVFVINESEMKADPGRHVLEEFGRLQGKMPGPRAFSAADAVTNYRRADELAAERAKHISLPKPDENVKKKGKAATKDEDVSAGSIRKQLQGDQ